MIIAGQILIAAIILGVFWLGVKTALDPHIHSILPWFFIGGAALAALYVIF